MFAGVDWLGVALGFVAAFAAGWWYYGPKGLYPAWSRSSGVSHSRSDKMGVPFGTLTLGLALYSLFVGVMMAQDQCGPLALGILAFIVLGYSNNAFKKLGETSRLIDAGSWALSGALMVLAQWLV